MPDLNLLILHPANNQFCITFNQLQKRLIETPPQVFLSKLQGTKACTQSKPQWLLGQRVKNANAKSS